MGWERTQCSHKGSKRGKKKGVLDRYLQKGFREDAVWAQRGPGLGERDPIRALEWVKRWFRITDLK